MKPRQMQTLLAALGLGIGLDSWAVLAQAPPPAAQTPAESFAERVEVEVVNVDVIVTDRNEKRILDLGRNEFEILVDGRPVAIEYFAAPRLAGAPAAPQALSPERIPELAIAPLPATAAPLTPPTHLIFYIDQTALENRVRQQTVEELREFLAARPVGDDRVMVAAFEQNLRVLLLPTTDRASIVAALDELEKVPVRALLGLSEKNRLEQDVRAYGKNALRVEASLGRRPSQEGFERVVTTRRAEALRLEHEITVWAEQELERERRSIVALERLVGALAAVEGRKAVVLATAGIQGFPARGLFAALDQQRQGPVKLTSSDTNRAPTLEVRGQELLLAFEQMVQAAQNARVAFYTVSPGTPPPPDNNAEFAGTGATSARMLPRDTGVVEAASSVARLAGATGGASFTVGTDLDLRLAAVTADGDAAYSLGFSTSAAAGEKDHKIEVRALRAGLEVRHRESFRRRSAPQRAEASLAAAVTFGQAENPLEITLQLGAGKGEGKKRSGQSVPLTVGIPLRFVTLVPEGELRRGRVSVRVAIQDARGRMLESSAAIVPIDVPESQMARAMESSWYHRAEMRLAPGRQRVAVAVLDEVSGLQSTTFAEIEIPGKK
ncbi:MAG: VWA domain-containing protein [Thermoanaerobaculia bacterium]|nr:VWA domain-containing protein [Thermoanaerobaculia bacterium]